MPNIVVTAQVIFTLIHPHIFRVSLVDYIVCGQDQLPVFTSKVYNAVASLWKPWLDEEAISTLRKGKWKIYSSLFYLYFLSQFMLFRLRSLMFAWVCQFCRVPVPSFSGGLIMFESRGVAWMVSGPRAKKAGSGSQWLKVPREQGVLSSLVHRCEWGYTFKPHLTWDCSSSGLFDISSSVFSGKIHVCSHSLDFRFHNISYLNSPNIQK